MNDHAQDADKSGLVEELDIYIKSAERYERGDTDFQKALPAGTLKVLRAEINALARLRKDYSELFVEHQNVVASREAWRGRAQELEGGLERIDNIAVRKTAGAARQMQIAARIALRKDYA